MAQQISTNTFGCAKWIVSSDATQGTHTTISGALTSASSGDTIFIRPGTYTENLTLKAGVNITAYDCDALTPNVTIAGTCTLTTAGSVSISGIRLQTNSAAAIAVTGSAASILNIVDCYLNFTNNTGITYSSSSASSAINIKNCKGNLGTTGIGLFTHTSAGRMEITYTNITNSGASTTASTCSSGVINLEYCFITSPITTSGTSAFTWDYVSIDCAVLNTTAATLGGSGLHACRYSRFNSGTASAVSIGSSTPSLQYCIIQSKNTNAITGAGALTSSIISFEDTSNKINTTTQAPAINRFGVELSTTHPAFLGYLATTALNKTGNGIDYTLGTDALTEIFDQNNNFTTAGVFTAPYTGRYELTGAATCVGNTIASNLNVKIVTSNRMYIAQQAQAAGSSNLTATKTVLADMDVGDTYTCLINVSGEASATSDVYGAADLYTYMCGSLRC